VVLLQNRILAALAGHHAEEDWNMRAKATCTCRRCGTCCLADMLAYVTEQDRQRWHAEGRTDILEVVEDRQVLWAGDHLVSARDGRYLHGCPFLELRDGYTACSIYDTRPQVCRDFRPGSSQICPLWRPSTEEEREGVP